MSMPVVAALAFVSLILPFAVHATSSDELAEIREQMNQLREVYEAQLKALEERLEKAESLVERNRTQIEQRDPQPVVVQARSGGGLTNNAFNPAISVILQGSVNSYSKDPDDYALPGFQLGGEAGLAAEGFTLDETELTASASIDQWFYGQTTIALHDDEQDTEVEVEEAYADPLMLPVGFAGRFGRFYSDVGYLNRRHTHTWDFRDAPLAYRAFLGKQYRDDGVRVSWTAPTDIYVMLGGETYAGRQFPAGESESVIGDVQTAFLKLGGDIGSSHAWQAGVSTLIADVNDRDGGGHDHGSGNSESLFSGDSDLYMADFVYKWAPQGNPRSRNFIFQTEYFYREEDGDVQFTEGTSTALLNYDGDQQGWYAQAVYQFMPKWRIGARYDWLDADNHLNVVNLGGFSDPNEVIGESGFDDEGHDPQRYSLMLDWSPSEFSRIRAQYNRDESRAEGTDNQWTLQYIMSLGAHGAHEF
ncbi:MAG: hypothetical protein WBN08_21345 [Thiogranum sp.]